ncbi:hypothetical protein [Nonomuraea guangzhouensis]|uniref:Uncharacterized protein n=1 Tax=Nonomuraea guangzhouensis TaxID=1291555 RepID=A0ABW4GUD3_9ACTN|nr:hypothetical protein [Nonomuraea guangzhouensis]
MLSCPYVRQAAWLLSSWVSRVVGSLIVKADDLEGRLICREMLHS